MIRLYQYAPAFGLPSASPFCMKLETWLRLAGLPFEIDNRGAVLGSPKGKLPFIVDEDGTVRADSQLIIEHLAARLGDPLDARLTPLERAQATAFQRLFEESLYWVLVHTRWVEPAGWALTRQVYFNDMSPWLRWIVSSLVRRGLRRDLRGHGLGRHGAAEIDAIGQRDITAVADFLGGKPFMLGDAPTTLDATAYAFLAHLLWAPFDSPLREHARSRPTLEAYCRRMRETCYPTT